MSKLIPRFTEQPVSIIFHGRELFHVYVFFQSVVFYPLWRFLILVFGFDYLVCFLKITRYNLTLPSRNLFEGRSSFPLHSGLAEVGTLRVWISPNMFIFLMNIFSGWAGKLQTRHPVVLSEPVLCLDWKNPGLLLNDRGSTDQLLCSMVSPDK